MSRRLLLLIFLLILSPSALAQYGASGYGNPALRISESPPFTRADIRIMDSVLGLTAEQRELTDALFSDFFDRYREEATTVRLKVEALVEEAAITQNQQPLHRGTNEINLWNKRQEEIRQQFVEDLRLLMDQNQIQLWHKVERERAAWNAIKPNLTRDQLAELPKLDMETVWFPNINWFGL